jgi:hypothetical protein
VKDTNLRTEFLLQIRKQWEVSAILLANNRPEHKDKTKNRPTETEKKNFKGKGTAGNKQGTRGLTRSSPLTRL